LREALVDAIDRYDPEITLSPETATRAAEIAIYLGRLDEAEAALALAPPSTFAAILDAEFDLGRGAYETAIEKLEQLDDSDPLAARIVLDKARGTVMLERWQDLLRYAELTIVTAQCDRDRAIEGMGYRLRAIALRELGREDEQSDRDFLRAVELLRESEDLRFRAFAEVSYASCLVVTDRAVEAATLLDSALLTFTSLGLERDAQIAAHALAFADLVAGRYEVALDRSLQALSIDRAQGLPRGESWALKAGALAAVYAGRLDQALELSEALVSLCQMAGSVSELIEAHIIRYRARARAGDSSAVADLQAFLPAVDAIENPVVSATARVIFADAALGKLPNLQAFAAYDAAMSTGVPSQPWLAAELRHLDERWKQQPIRREANNMVIDLTKTTSLEAEHIILDFARITTAESRARRIEDAAPELGLSRRTFFKVRAAVKARLAGEGTKPRRRRVR